MISGASDLVSLLGLGSSAPSKLLFDFSATQTSVSLSLIGTAINSDFNDTFTADNAVATPGGQQVSASDAPKSLPHPGLTPAHSDTLESASLTATVVTSFPGFIDDIHGFTFQTMAVHTPEPTIAFLLAIGCVLLFAYGRRTI